MVRYSGPVFISNEKNFNVEVYRVKGDTRTTVINTLENPSSIIPLDPERTIWTYATAKYWDYSAEKYEVYYSSDICERRLELEIPKSQFGDKAGFADFVYNNLTYRTYTKDHIHDYISGIQYPDGTQYLVKDSRAVGLVGDDIIYGKKVFSNDYGTFGNAIVLSSTGTNCNFPFSFQLPSYTKGNTPSSGLYCGIDFYGSKRTAYTDRIGNIEFSLSTAKLSSVSIQAYDCNLSSSTDLSSISIFYPAGGTPYTQAPTPTDTTTTTGTQIATTGWVNSTDNNVVHKTGYETIGGEKNFTSNLARVNTNFTKGTNPSTTYYNAVEFTDKNGIGNTNRVGMLETSIAANGLISTYITAYKYANNSTNNARIAVIYPTSGNPYTEAPASDVNGSIVTTVNKSKAKNGYFQLGNGLIINWGTSGTLNEGSSLTITLPKAFTSTNYSVTANFKVQHTAQDAEGVITVDNFTTTTLRLSAGYLDPKSGTVSWIAVVY